MKANVERHKSLLQNGAAGFSLRFPGPVSLGPPGIPGKVG
jgi:hypothetical protein